VVDALYQARLHGLPHSVAAWRVQMAMVERLEQIWQQPDRGMWESRDLPQRFTHSQAMLWTAFDRAISTAEHENLDAPLERWRAVRDQLHDEICQQGFNTELNSFVRSFGSTELDASVLLLPQIGFLPASDPRIAGTVDAIGQRLMKDGFIMRYDSEVSKDGLPPGEGSFLACSFWYADVLAMMGRYDEADEMFGRVIAIRNDLGLLAEGYDPVSGTLTGNFPQALSHLALVNTALNLTRPDGPAKRRGKAE
jgi:GH15 family glucan-1,4-alpha-glucosidase